MTSPSAYVVAGDAEGRPVDRACAHLDHVRQVEPATARACEDCLREGTQWVYLRQCLECGHVGCCDSSPRQHASAHWRATHHPIVRSLERGENWAWCFPDALVLLPTES